MSKKIIWRCIVSSLLTTQQRSGPGSPVTRFIWTDPFLLDYTICLRQNNIRSFVVNIITEFGGIRRSRKIGEAASDNFKFLEGCGWSKVLSKVQSLQASRTPQFERETARFIAEKLKGFGPKQSRNLLQSLGLARYEIPVDSRITKWLNEFGFPIKLSASALSDENYYSFVLDGLQELCKQCEIYPCVLDAAIFSSFDPEWPQDKPIW